MMTYHTTLIFIVHILYILLLIAAAIPICPFGTLYKKLSLFLLTGDTKKKFILNSRGQKGLLMCICGGSTSKSHHKNSPPLLNYVLNGHPGPCPDKEVFALFLVELCLSDKKPQ